MIGQWPWPRTTMRDLLLGLTSKGAAVVAFDVLFAEPDRTSVEAIVKQLPAHEAGALTTIFAGRPSNNESLPPRSRTRQVFYPLPWEKAQIPHCQRKRGSPMEATIHDPSYWGSMGSPETSPSSRIQHVESAR